MIHAWIPPHERELVLWQAARPRGNRWHPTDYSEGFALAEELKEARRYA